MAAKAHLNVNIVFIVQGKYHKKNYEPFLRNLMSNIAMSCQLLIRFRHIICSLFSMFPWTPVWQTSAAKWLHRLIWIEIFSIVCRETIMKKIRAVFEKSNIKDSRVMSASDQISPYHLFPFLYVSMNASLTNQRGQMAVQAHLKGNILYCVPGI